MSAPGRKLGIFAQQQAKAGQQRKSGVVVANEASAAVTKRDAPMSGSRINGMSPWHRISVAVSRELPAELMSRFRDWRLLA